VRINDPRNQLADDALMATANAHFLRAQFSDADFHYGLLRTEYPKSEHLLPAYQLGLQCKLKKYQGAGYDGIPLEEADELINQMLVQFPTELQEERERLLVAKAEIGAQRALREWNTAQFYDNGEKYAAAKIYYNQIIKEYPQTPFAQQSRERLAAIQTLPDVPPDKLEFITQYFETEQEKKDRAIAESIDTNRAIRR